MLGLIGGIAQLGAELIDNLVETDEEKAEAKAKLIKLQQDGKLRLLEQRLAVMLSEARSFDAWTSRARPSFLYVVYIFLLAAIPMGVFFAFVPERAEGVTAGVSYWLRAVPESVWTLFGVGYLGYTGARSFDKSRIGRLGK